MRARIKFKERIAVLLVFGLTTGCVFGADGAHQAADFTEQAKDRHVGKILLPVVPRKPPQVTVTEVVKTSSTKPLTSQSKVQNLIESLRSNRPETEVKGAKPIVQGKAQSAAAEKMPSTKLSDKSHGAKDQASKESARDAHDTKEAPLAGKNPVGKNAVKEKDTDKAPKTSSSSHPKTKTLRNDGFIPPPPPVQPSILMTGEMNSAAIMPFTVEYMNKDELLEKQKELASQLSDAKDQLKETEEAGTEKKTRAERFDPLYKEGVVSRHELEAAQKEALDVDKEVERAKNRVDQIANQALSVDKKLKEIEKRTLPLTAPARKKSRK